MKGFLAKYKWLNRSIKKQKINIRIKTKIVVKNHSILKMFLEASYTK